MFPSFRSVRAAVALSVLSVIGLAAISPRVSTDRGVGTSMIAGSSIRFVGPFYSTQQSYDSTTGGQVGGEVRIYNAASTDTLRIGDVVFESANNTAGKSATASNHEKVLGVVVGGRSTNLDCSINSADVGTIAALPNRPAVVLRRGRTYVRVDSITATDTVHAGDRIKPSTLRAGWVMPASSTITAAVSTTDTTHALRGPSVYGATVALTGDGFNKIFGTAVKLAVPGATVLADINAK